MQARRRAQLSPRRPGGCQARRPSGTAGAGLLPLQLLLRRPVLVGARTPLQASLPVALAPCALTTLGPEEMGLAAIP